MKKIALKIGIAICCLVLLLLIYENSGCRYSGGDTLDFKKSEGIVSLSDINAGISTMDFSINTGLDYSEELAERVAVSYDLYPLKIMSIIDAGDSSGGYSYKAENASGKLRVNVIMDNKDLKYRHIRLSLWDGNSMLDSVMWKNSYSTEDDSKLFTCDEIADKIKVTCANKRELSFQLIEEGEWEDHSDREVVIILNDGSSITDFETMNRLGSAGNHKRKNYYAFRLLDDLSMEQVKEIRIGDLILRCCQGSE